MVSCIFTIPKAFGFGAATQSQEDNLQIHALQNINLEFVLWN